MKEQIIITRCDQCGKNARFYIYSDFSVGFCKKHLPDEYKQKITNWGFEMKNL